MNPTEAMNLCRMVRAVCPHQKMDELTPDTWSLVLAHVRFVDARDALVALAQRQPFIAPAEIIAEVKRIRARRLGAVDTLDPPSNLDELGYRRWLTDTRRRIADGSPAPTAKALPVRDMHVIDVSFQAVPDGLTRFREARADARTGGDA